MKLYSSERIQSAEQKTIIPTTIKLNIKDEFSPLKSVVVCSGESIPAGDSYRSDDPEEMKWGWKVWDTDLLIKQHEGFLNMLLKYDVELVCLDTDPDLIWQMYTRDTGFVIGDTLFYAGKRTLKARSGEIKRLLQKISVDENKVCSLPGKIEGGDILVSDVSCAGISNRTDNIALDELSKHTKIRRFDIGNNVMHLDTRMTLLPDNYTLVHLNTFSKEDQDYISEKYKIISVSKEETKTLGTNVFIVNPDTIIVEERQKRIGAELINAGFNVEYVGYSEPIVLDGSFHCTTLPLIRE